jgi:hypothetical protein
MLEISSETVQARQLTLVERQQMYRLMARYYLGTNWEDFTRDLQEKEQVMLLRDVSAGANGDIVGFSTLTKFDLSIQNEEVKAIFSGDTIVEARYRRSFGFANEISTYFVRTLAATENRVYYILICKGWRTYRILPFLFRDFAPRYDRPTPEIYQEVIDAFGRSKYPDRYDPGTGRILFAGEIQRIRPGSAEAFDERRAKHPHVRFFHSRNPGHLQGDELVCAAEVTPSNLTTAMRKLLLHRKSTVRSHGADDDYCESPHIALVPGRDDAVAESRP